MSTTFHLREGRRISVTTCLVLVLLAAPSAVPAQPERPPLSNVQGEVVNFETPLIDPILVTADGEHVVAVNEPDGRVVVRRVDDLSIVAEVPAGRGLSAVAERPGGGEVWASATHSSAVMVIDTATWRVTHALRPEPADASEALESAAAPGAVAFSADGTKAWVTATATDELLVYDAEAKTHLKTVPVAVEHNGRTSRMREPRTVVRHGDTLYVGVYRSGNNTVAGPVDVFGLHPKIIDLDRVEGLSLPDADVVAFSAADESVLFHQKAVGTLILGLAVHPETGDLLVANMEALNGEILGERAAVDGRFTLNRLAVVTPGSQPASYRQVALEDLPDGGGTTSLAMPNDVVVDPAGRVFVAAYASAAIGAFDSQGTLLGILASDRGPRGLAVDPAGERLFSLNRVDGTITGYQIGDSLPAEPFVSVPIGPHDPTYDRVAEGRALFNDAARSSGGGSTGCFSCHPDLQADGVAWNLSEYHEPGAGFTVDDPPRFWKDLKGSMVTQDSRSLEDSAPYHWRGERKVLGEFNETFATVQKGEPLSAAEFELLEDYTFSAVYPANPHQPLARDYSDFALYGSQVFRFDHWTDDALSVCNDCHRLPTGSRGSINGRLVLGPHTVANHLLKGMSSPQFRGQWTKQSDHANVVESGGQTMLVPVTGYGVEHTGSHRDVRHYVERQFVGFGDPQKQEAIIEFLSELDTGVAPFANYSYLLDRGTVDDFDAGLFLEQVERLHCDLAAHGRVVLDGEWRRLGLYFDRDQGAFVTHTSGLGPFSFADLEEMASAGKLELLILGVPVWSGERVGVDRDRDGLYDGDERSVGTDPTAPDTDGDGFWDSVDDDPLDPEVTSDDGSAPQVVSAEVQFVTTNAIRLLYETDTFTPTQVDYGEDGSFGRSVGDPFPLPEGSNHWKRRHSIVLPTLDDGVTYHFQIRTLGQNGVEGASEEMTATTVSDSTPLIPETMHVDSIDLETAPAAEGTEVTATVRLVSHRGEPVPDALVHGVWTLFRDGEPTAQMDGDGGPTDGDGVTTVSLVVDAPTAGVEVDFTVPQYRGRLPDDDVPGAVDTVRLLDRRFAWSDNVEFSERVALE